MSIFTFTCNQFHQPQCAEIMSKQAAKELARAAGKGYWK